MADGLCSSTGNAPAIVGAAVRWCMELPGGITCALEDYDLGSETTLVTSTAAPGIFSSVMALDESLRLVLRDTAGSSGEGSLAISAKTLIDTARSWHLAGITRPCRLLVIQMTQIPAMSCIVSLRIVEIRKDGRRAHAGMAPWRASPPPFSIWRRTVREPFPRRSVISPKPSWRTCHSRAIRATFLRDRSRWHHGNSAVRRA